MVLSFIKRILTCTFLIFFGVIFFLMVFRMPTVIFIAYVALASVLVNRIGDRGVIIFIILGSFLIRLAYISIINTPLESDFKLLYDAAVLFSQGDYSFSQQVYFQEWGYQTGFVIYQGMVVRVFGQAGGITALKVLNCFWNTGITLLVYLIARNFFSEKPSRLASVLYSGFVFPITFVSVLSNQHISTFLILLGLYFLMDQRLIRMKLVPRGLIAGFLLALGNIMRPEGLVVVTSLMVYFLVLFFSADKKWRRMERIAQCLVVVLIYLAVNSMASQAIIKSGINDQGLKNNNVYWKFVVGLNYESKGSYNEKDYKLMYESNLSLEEKKELQKDLILKRLRIDPLKLVNLFMVKIQTMWCDSALDWSYKHILMSNRVVYLFSNPVKFSDIDAVLKDLNELFIYTAIGLSLLGMLTRWKSQMKDGLLIPVTILVISFVIYLFIEVQPRYAYLQQPFMFILSGAGLEILLCRINAFNLKQVWARLWECAKERSEQEHRTKMVK